MTNHQEVLKQMNRSGFPFQLGVEEEIRRTRSIHNWSIASHEHPWSNPETGFSGFIDIVLTHDQFSTFRMVLECKRMKANDARQLRWLFLIPKQEVQETQRASCLEVEGNSYDNSWEDIRLWDDVSVTPSSPESEFCVLPNDEQRRQPILESLSADVLESIEGLAEEEARIEQSGGGPGHLRLFMFPAIVTNAELIVCRFNSEDIKISDGTLDSPNLETTTVPFIRFRKSISSRFPTGRFHNLRDTQKARERTVFIVNALKIADFLTGWQVNPLGHTGFAIQRRSN